MKKIAIGLLGIGLAALATAQELDPILKKRVENGRVDYRGLKADSQPLTDYLQWAGAVPEAEFNAWPEKRQLAFLVNLYNASTLQLIVGHYPVKSIKKIRKGFKGPWDQKVVVLHGKKISLNTLEHKIIRPTYKEPRVHMALVCAAKGCPILRSEAYTAERLDEQLDDQSRRYLATSAGLVIDRKKGTASISSIFKWYGDDFVSVPAFVERYSDEEIAGLQINYLDYDWSLNGK
jgi:hypothetical protein